KYYLGRKTLDFALLINIQNQTNDRRCPGGELRSPAAVAMETPTARFSLGARPAGGFSSAPAFPHPAQRAPRVRDHPGPSPGTAREGAERESPPQRQGDSNPPRSLPYASKAPRLRDMTCTGLGYL
uniref:Uncharacterized protein n=1 Tax=Gopherus agassizii TaxID=38772 RepID=A0A452HZS2_9SAUR